ncbi:MAG: glycosyltransferase family 4 protein [Deltaproteobacteria bacterium]|nr:glycosyltransferase family 4 protein [Deltaproteobacteria bacterium]
MRLRRGLASLKSRGFDFVFFQRTAIPETAIFEKLSNQLNPRTIFDFDDAIFLGPSGAASLLRQRAFKAATSFSRHLIAGNRFLAESAEAPGKTSVIPTVIDADRYSPTKPGAQARYGTTIGWMGTSTNFRFLEYVAPAIQRVLAQDKRVRLRLVSNAYCPVFKAHPQVEQIPWSAEKELELLRSFDVGIMPLEDNQLTRGKCAFKMILYMAVGCPVVVSPVGANIDVLDQSEAGYLAPDHETWAARLIELVSNEALRRSMGAAGRARVVSTYSVASVIDRYIEIFEKVRQR